MDPARVTNIWDGVRKFAKQKNLGQAAIKKRMAQKMPNITEKLRKQGMNSQ